MNEFEYELDKAVSKRLRALYEQYPEWLLSYQQKHSVKLKIKNTIGRFDYDNLQTIDKYVDVYFKDTNVAQLIKREYEMGMQRDDDMLLSSSSTDLIFNGQMRPQLSISRIDNIIARMNNTADPVEETLDNVFN